MQQIGKLGVACRTPKYRNRKCVYDGIDFDSESERTRYVELKLLEQAGEIDSLSLQVEIRCIINKVWCWSYWADFVYREKGSNKLTIEDHKGSPEMVKRDFKIKWKTLLAIYGRTHKMQLHYTNGEIVVMPALEDLQGFVPPTKGDKKNDDLDFTGVCKKRRDGNYIRWTLNKKKARMRNFKRIKE